MLLCDFDVRRTSHRWPEGSEYRLSAPGQVLLRTGSKLLAHAVDRIGQRKVRSAWIEPGLGSTSAVGSLVGGRWSSVGTGGDVTAGPIRWRVVRLVWCAAPAGWVCGVVAGSVGRVAVGRMWWVAVVGLLGCGWVNAGFADVRRVFEGRGCVGRGCVVHGDAGGCRFVSVLW